MRTLVSAFPVTFSLSSPRSWVSSSALLVPMLFCRKKKLFPAFSGVTFSASRTVNVPIPIGQTLPSIARQYEIVTPQEISDALDSWNWGKKMDEPGRTRFLSACADVALPDKTSTRDDSSADWPDAAHNLSIAIHFIWDVIFIVWMRQGDDGRTGVDGRIDAYGCLGRAIFDHRHRVSDKLI